VLLYIIVSFIETGLPPLWRPLRGFKNLNIHEKHGLATAPGEVRMLTGFCVSFEMVGSLPIYTYIYIYVGTYNSCLGVHRQAHGNCICSANIGFAFSPAFPMAALGPRVSRRNLSLRRQISPRFAFLKPSITLMMISSRYGARFPAPHMRVRHQVHLQ